VTAQAPKPIYREIKPGRTLEVYGTAGDLFHASAYKVASILNNCLQKKPECSVALSGGSTPKRLYELLAQKEGGAIDWGRVQVFFSDERNVPPIDAESNYGMAKAALFSNGLVPDTNIHRVKGELAAAAAAEEYEQEIRCLLPDPAFDLILLGLGADGHTASLFPASPALTVQE
jgi:6-phosphogluconolactonase